VRPPPRRVGRVRRGRPQPKFDHPVPVEFLTPEEYRDEVELDETDLVADDEAFYEDQAALLRALGLAEGDLDLLDARNELADGGTLAFYEPAAERIVVRIDDPGDTGDADEIDVGLEVTLVHELTHVLQHQHLPDLFPEDETTGGESFAMTGLVEGDAMRIELDYVDSLDRDEQAEYDEITADQFEDRQEAVADVPASMVAFFEAPYLLGDPFVTLLDAMGDVAVDEAFAEPPSSDEQLIDPFRYLDADQPDLLDPPEVEGDVVDDGDFGAVGWRGDGYNLYETDGVLCAAPAAWLTTWSGGTPSTSWRPSTPTRRRGPVHRRRGRLRRQLAILDALVVGIRP
jgi:hypothetical protein